MTTLAPRHSTEPAAGKVACGPSRLLADTHTRIATVDRATQAIAVHEKTRWMLSVTLSKGEA